MRSLDKPAPQTEKSPVPTTPLKSVSDSWLGMSKTIARSQENEKVGRLSMVLGSGRFEFKSYQIRGAWETSGIGETPLVSTESP